MYVQFRLLKVCIWTASFLQGECLDPREFVFSKGGNETKDIFAQKD